MPQTIADFPHTDSPPRVACPKCGALPDTFCLTPSGRRTRSLFHDDRYVAAYLADPTPASMRPLRADDAAVLRRVRDEVMTQVVELLQDEADDRASAYVHHVDLPYADTYVAAKSYCLDLIAVLGRTDASLEDFARVASEILAWDSQSFVALCGVQCDDVRALDVTPRDLETLARLNGGRRFAYNLHDWST